MKKKLGLLLCLAVCVLTMAGCNLTSLTTTNKNFAKSTLKSSTEEYIQNWFNTDYQTQIDQIDQTLEYYDAMADQMSEDELASYLEQREEIAATREEYQKQADDLASYGKFKKRFGKIDYTISSDSATVTENIETDNGKKIVFSVTYDKEGKVTDSKIDEYKTLGQKMSKAGLNTVMCMAIVFLVLIFIALIISLFRFINPAPKKQEPQAAVEASAAQAAQEENLVDDLELVAVITAAVAAASETESADGLVIRSIIRR